MKRGLSQAALARAIEVPQQHISDFELGKRKPPLDVLIRIADALNCTLDYLVDRAPIPERAPEELAPYEQDMIAWSRGQGRDLTDEDFLNYRLEHHPENPQLKGPGKTPKV